jgi:hypothetical protein
MNDSDLSRMRSLLNTAARGVGPLVADGLGMGDARRFSELKAGVVRKPRQKLRSVLN